MRSDYSPSITLAEPPKWLRLVLIALLPFTPGLLTSCSALPAQKMRPANLW